MRYQKPLLLPSIANFMAQQILADALDIHFMENWDNEVFIELPANPQISVPCWSETPFVYNHWIQLL